MLLFVEPYSEERYEELDDEPSPKRELRVSSAPSLLIVERSFAVTEDFVVLLSELVPVFELAELVPDCDDWSLVELLPTEFPPTEIPPAEIVGMEIDGMEIPED